MTNGALTLQSFGLTPAAILRHTVKITASVAYRPKVQRSLSLLERMGLTPEVIRRHVVSIAPPVVPDDLDAMKIYRAKQKAKREANKAAGLTAHGTVRQRKTHPELAGLPKAEYIRQYTQKYRQIHGRRWT